MYKGIKKSFSYHLITNDEDSIRQVGSDSLEKRDLLAVDASSDCRPSYSSLDRDSHRMDLDVYILENKELYKIKKETIVNFSHIIKCDEKLFNFSCNLYVY